MKKASLKEALLAIGRQCDAIAKKHPDGSYYLSSNARVERQRREILKALEKRCTIDLTDADIVNVVDLLRKVSHLGIILSNVEHEDIPKITIKANNIPLKDILKQIMEQNNLQYTVKNWGICISVKPNKIEEDQPGDVF